MLSISKVETFYGNIQALRGVNIKVNSGEIVTLIGSNGAGKSTLINLLIPDLNLKTSEISSSHLTGKHTTTFAEMFDYNPQTTIIDTPGIKGFGLVDFDKEELATYFPEMLVALKNCKFHNCRHLNEPGCEVLKQLENQHFSQSRYQSYLAMYHEDTKANYRKNDYI